MAHKVWEFTVGQGSTKHSVDFYHNYWTNKKKVFTVGVKAFSYRMPETKLSHRRFLAAFGVGNLIAFITAFSSVVLIDAIAGNFK